MEINENLKCNGQDVPHKGILLISNGLGSFTCAYYEIKRTTKYEKNGFM